MPDDVDDIRMTTMSEEIARRIEAELQYPGQIKVVLIRETRAVDLLAERSSGAGYDHRRNGARRRR